MREVIEPTATSKKSSGGDKETVYTHPAYGQVSLNITQGGDVALYGSEIGHGQRVCIRVKHSEMHRHLSRDWHHARGLPIVEFDMSHAQFAEFITSPNYGEGIPCTLRYIEGEAIPGIQQIETKHAMFKREVQESAKRHLTAMRDEIGKLRDMVETGKMPKAELRNLLADLERHCQQLPGSLAFVVGQAEEAIENATTAAKIDIEATIAHHIQRIGQEAAMKVGLLAPPTD